MLMDLTEKNDDNSSNGRKVSWDEIPKSKPQAKSWLLPVISYNIPETNKSCLEGLSVEDKLWFQEIVQKQFYRGIKIIISYGYLDSSSDSV